MTTDPTPLQERIERILAEHPIQPPTYAGDAPIAVKRKRTAARIAEEVAAEVRKAQADAWDEGQASGWDNAREESDQHGGVCAMWKPHTWLTPNAYREQED